MKTLIIIDMQNDFMPGGALAVAEGDVIIPVINRIQRYFDLRVATQDWHAPQHQSFASSHPGHHPYDTIKLHGLTQILWPDHCIQGTFGAALHSELDSTGIETIFRKATDPQTDSYSGFYDNGRQKSTGLAGYLREKGARDLYFCGLAADFCVYFSIKDALQEGFRCWLIEDATRPLDAAHFRHIKKELMEQGVTFIHSTAIPSSPCQHPSGLD
ncbi:MAG: bifunctional nicotinamidase/pyrazinamidase [Legionellaceae bacterium]|nr:bifunctional nicotinamidase/pyrazinamidase [Legionellaceae bacterium]